MLPVLTPLSLTAVKPQVRNRSIYTCETDMRVFGLEFSCEIIERHMGAGFSDEI